MIHNTGKKFCDEDIVIVEGPDLIANIRCYIDMQHAITVPAGKFIAAVVVEYASGGKGPAAISFRPRFFDTLAECQPEVDAIEAA